MFLWVLFQKNRKTRPKNNGHQLHIKKDPNDYLILNGIKSLLWITIWMSSWRNAGESSESMFPDWVVWIWWSPVREVRKFFHLPPHFIPWPFFFFALFRLLILYCCLLRIYIVLWSTGIDTVVERKNGDKSSVGGDALCIACEMAVVWIQNQLKQNQTKERILSYVNEVIYGWDTALGLLEEGDIIITEVNWMMIISYCIVAMWTPAESHGRINRRLW